MGTTPTLEDLYKEVQKTNQLLESIAHVFGAGEKPVVDAKKWAAEKAEKLRRKLNAKMES